MRKKENKRIKECRRRVEVREAKKMVTALRCAHESR